MSKASYTEIGNRRLLGEDTEIHREIKEGDFMSGHTTTYETPEGRLVTCVTFTEEWRHAV
jgi:hypothetical protein